MKFAVVETFCRIQHLLRLLRIERHRLFAEDIGSGFESGNRQRFVLIVRNGDGNNVELLLFDHVDTFVIDLSLECRMFLRKKSATVFAAVRNGDHFHIGMRQISRKMSATHAESDNSGFQFLSHVISPNFLKFDYSADLSSSSGSTIGQPESRLIVAAAHFAALTRTFWMFGS